MGSSHPRREKAKDYKTVGNPRSKADRLFSFGGIWDRWKDRATGNVLESFAIVTVDPNEALEPFHSRCPLIIEPKDYPRWLAPAEPSRLPIDLVRTYPAEGMKVWRVAPLKDDGPQLLEPLKTHLYSICREIRGAQPRSRRSGSRRSPSLHQSRVPAVRMAMTANP
jgi:putative SOS response-associated peptidase YedK